MIAKPTTRWYSIERVEYFLEFVAYQMRFEHTRLYQFKGSDISGLIEVAYRFGNGQYGNLSKYHLMINFEILMDIFNEIYSVGRYNLFQRIQFRNIIKKTEEFLYNNSDLLENFDNYTEEDKYNHAMNAWNNMYNNPWR